MTLEEQIRQLVREELEKQKTPAPCPLEEGKPVLIRGVSVGSTPLGECRISVRESTEYPGWKDIIIYCTWGETAVKKAKAIVAEFGGSD